MKKTKKELIRRLELLADSDIKVSIILTRSGRIFEETGSLETTGNGGFFLFMNETIRILIEPKEVLELSLLAPIWRHK